MTTPTSNAGTIFDRIDDALKGGPMSFHDLALRIYPDEKSHRCSSNGGPPGCYMSLSAALSRGRYYERWIGRGPGNRIVHPRKMAP